MLQVGLTGGIGSGKSTVAKVFETLGVPVYYADARAKYLMNFNQELREGIISLLGNNAYLNGVLNPSFISKQVFGNKEKLEKLNALVHPAVGLDYKLWVERQTTKYGIKEAAILFESGSYKTCDVVINVFANEDIRVSRVIKRDGVTEKQVKARLKHQWTEKERFKHSDYSIDNNGGTPVIPQIIKLHNKLLNETV